jgi:hypothetical protein
MKNMLLVAAWWSGFARLLFALGVCGSNPGVDNGEKGTNHLSPFFELYLIKLVYFMVI